MCKHVALVTDASTARLGHSFSSCGSRRMPQCPPTSGDSRPRRSTSPPPPSGADQARTRACDRDTSLNHDWFTTILPVQTLYS